MASNFQEHTNRSPESHRKKRRRIESTNQETSNLNRNGNLNIGTSSANQNQIRWRSPSEQHIYSSKLLEALRQVRRRSAAASPAAVQPSRSRVVREAADKVLAIAARGRTRWSRAILTNRLKLRLKSHKKVTVKAKLPAAVTGSGRLSGGGSEERQVRLPPLEKRVKVLGRLVPGCRKLSFPNLLEETTDYIAALQMQVRAMAALAELLNNSAAAAAGSSTS